MTLKSGISRFVFLTLFLACASLQQAGSAELPKPNGAVLLTLSGNITNANKSGVLELDIEMLEQLESISFVTDTPWTDAPTEFTGVRIKHLLEFAGAKTNNFKAHAVDKYWNDLTDIDFDKIPAIIAYKRDGKTMRVRDLGPLWIMFPFDDFPELDNEKYKTACVWQLIEIDVH